MITLKKDNLIDETKLDREESIVFVMLLQKEIRRHQREYNYAIDVSWFLNPVIDDLKICFWKCQLQNHTTDMIMIQICIDYLVKKWSLKDV